MSGFNTPNAIIASARHTGYVKASALRQHEGNTMAVSHHPPLSRTNSNTYHRSPSKGTDTQSSLMVATSAAVSVSFAADPSANYILQDSEYRALSLSLAQKPNVVSLSLQGNILSNPAVISLCSELSSPTSRLTSLNVSMCGLGNDKAARIVAAAISHVHNRRPTFPLPSQLSGGASGLRVLDLSLNHITEAGALAIAKSFNDAALAAEINNQSLTDSHRFVRSPSTRSASALSHRSNTGLPGPSLHTLVLRFNRISVRGLHQLLRATSDLRTIDARYCALNICHVDTFPQLLQALSESSTVSRLLLDGNGISTSQVDQMERQLALSTTGALRFEGITATSMVGALPAVERYIRSRRPPEGQLYPVEVVEECKKVVGETLIVRGELRDLNVRNRPLRPTQVAAPMVRTDTQFSRTSSAPRSSSSSRHVTKSAAARLEGVEVAATTAARCAGSFNIIASPRSIIVGPSGMSVSRRGLLMQGDAEQPRCAPCPTVNQRQIVKALEQKIDRSPNKQSLRAMQEAVLDEVEVNSFYDRKADVSSQSEPMYIPPETELEVIHEYH